MEGWSGAWMLRAVRCGWRRAGDGLLGSFAAAWRKEEGLEHISNARLASSTSSAGQERADASVARAEVAGVLAAARGLARPLPVAAARVSFLHQPQDFLQAVLDGVRRARRRVILATLYVGTGAGPGAEAEAELLAALAAAALDHAARPELRIHVLLDALRGTRPAPAATSAPSQRPLKGQQQQWVSSASLLAQHLLAPTGAAEAVAGSGGGVGRSSRVRVSLYHTPALRGPLRRWLPARWNEVLGVHHAKAAVFDDDVLLTGANLSREYFTSRQDRYALLSASPLLAARVERLAEAVAAGSFALTPDGGLRFGGGQKKGSATGVGRMWRLCRPPRPRRTLQRSSKRTGRRTRCSGLTLFFAVWPRECWP